MRRWTALALAAALAAATPAAADTETVPAPGAVSDADLRAYLEARTVVDGIVETLRLIAAQARGDGRDITGFRFAAQHAVEGAVAARGLQPARYNAIALAVRRYATLRHRVSELAEGAAAAQRDDGAKEEKP